MSNIINTYLKIQKCTFEEYQSSIKDANTIYFIIDQLKIFIGEKEYIQSGDRYYIPSVDEEGNLLWTPTKNDMQKIPPVNIKEIGEVTIDQIYKPESENAQSGKAVAEAIVKTVPEWARQETQPTAPVEMLSFETASDLLNYPFVQGVWYYVSIWANANFPINGYYFVIKIGYNTYLYSLEQSTRYFSFKWDTHEGLITRTHYTEVTDKNGYFTSYYLDDVLQEIGAKLGNIDTALDNIIVLQESYIGGATE